MTGWQEYVALARQLDGIRRAGERAAADVTHQQNAVSAGLAALDQRLSAQRDRLARLAGVVGQPYGDQPVQPYGDRPVHPYGDQPVRPADTPDPVQALHLASMHADDSDAACARAERLAQYPPLFPTWTPLARNLTVYALCALAAVIVQIALLAAAGVDHIGPLTMVGLLCAGLPGMAFAAGVTVLSIWGRPGLPDKAPPRHLRLGFAICFLAMPAAFCAYQLVTAVALP